MNEAVYAFNGALILVMQAGALGLVVWLWSEGFASIGDVVLVQGYIAILFAHFFGLARYIRSLFEAIAEAEEGIELLRQPHAVCDKIQTIPLTITEGAISFHKVRFNYNETRTVLDSLSLSITGGERVAFVGASGAGKTTITKLLLRLHDVTSGSISIDGVNIADAQQEELRKNIALVPQEPVLFHRSLMENIRYGRREATDEEVVEAAKQARCHEFISMLPEQYETLVGERGVKLSGGERQRIAIARAILKNAPILVLDEATSSLDSESEHLIDEALKTLMEGKTVIAIAHRLSTIMEMDRIIVLEAGKVVDEGTHLELIEREGIYKKLWDIQVGGYLTE